MKPGKCDRVLKNSILVLSLFAHPLFLFCQAPRGNGKVVTAVYTESRITLDGNLNEPVWETAEPAKDFIQKEPSEGEPASEWTEVRILYDRENLYIGAYCHDRTPQQIVVRDVTRDFEPLDQDIFGVELDTFNDDRNGFTVLTTPKGGLRDMQFFNEGREVNDNWDGVWYVETRIQEDGWTAEFAIPFKTLRFSRENLQIWGVNFFRRIRRRNELSHWSPVPRRYGRFQAALSGDLRGLEGLKPGRNLKVKPFVLIGMNRFSSQGKTAEGDFDGGVDVKYGLTSGLTLDLTLNTDFSQVEADTQQVNLTRFPLFFPEKREFFLENSGVFQFGETYQVGPPRSNEVLLFFSRKIGLSEEREPLPLLGGARMTGRAGPYYLGFMNIQTRSEGAVAANNFTVARLRRDLSDNADVGVMFLNRQSGQPEDYNRSFGADVNFQFFQRNLKLNGLLSKTETPGLRGDDGLAKVEVTWQGDVLRIIGSYLDIQKNFNPEMGFVRRPGRRILHNEFGLNLRLRRETRWGSFIRDIKPLVISDYAILPNGETETKLLRPNLRFDLQDGGAIELQYHFNFERLTEPFRIRRSPSHPITLPAGNYRFNEFVAWYFTNKSKPFAIDVKFRKGDFFNGNKTTLTAGGKFQSGYRFSTSVSYERNDVELQQGSFTTNLVGLLVNYTFSPRMFLNALIQYNSDTNQVSSNIRFRLIHRPLSDLYLVYNEQRDVQQDRNDRAITLKYTHLLTY